MGRSRSRSRSRSPPRRRSRSRSRSRGRDRDRDRKRQRSRSPVIARGEDGNSKRIAEDRAKRARLDAEYARKKRMEVLKEIRGDAVDDDEDDDFKLDFKSTIKGGAVTLEDVDMAEDEEARMMQRLLGFANFDTTKEKEVDSNKSTAAKGAIRKGAVRSYRQYMNRRGGFNRSLEKS